MLVYFLFLISSIFIIYILVGYKAILSFFVKNEKQRYPEYKPGITIIIPAYEEAEYLEEKLENITQVDYPKNKTELILVIDDSCDGSKEIARKYPLKLITSEERLGKVRAINRALEESNNDIIVLTDADTIMDEHSLQEIVAPLKNPDIGGVTGKVLPNPENHDRGEEFYLREQSERRLMEGVLDSVSSMDGRLCCFRRSIVEKLNEDSPADDLDLALSIREKGFSCILNERAFIHDKRSPEVFSKKLSQSKRRAWKTIQTVFAHFPSLLRSDCSFFSLFIFPSGIFLPLFMPFFLIFWFIFGISISTNYIFLVLAVFLVPLFSEKIRSTASHFLTYNLALLQAWIHFILTGNLRPYVRLII